MKIASTYTGAGGLDIGFIEAGATITSAVELDRAACQTLRLNNKNIPIFEGTVKNALASGFFNTNVDVLIGGPPCQGFSVAGKMNPQDPRSGEVFEYLRVLRQLKPKAFVMENVKALGQLSKWSFVRERIMSEARSSGYSVKMITLNAVEFGVPQKRERVFFIGLSTEIYKHALVDQALHDFELHLNDYKTSPPSVGKIIRALGPAGSQGNNRVCRAKITFAKSPVLRKSAYAGMLFNGAGRPLDIKGAASTLPASMGGNKTPLVDEDEIFNDKPSFVETYHGHLRSGGAPKTGDAPKRLRRLTVDECIAIQTFPTRYKFSGSQSAIYKQLGNAVPPKLAEAVARSLSATLDNLLMAKAKRSSGASQ